jgi:hypothetical protein
LPQKERHCFNHQLLNPVLMQSILNHLLGSLHSNTMSSYIPKAEVHFCIICLGGY